MDVLASSPVLLLAVILGVGYVAGGLRVAGVTLGVSAVFFAGLAASAVDERLRLPDFVDQFGLVLFVYVVGLTAGPAFFRAVRRRGLGSYGLVLTVIGVVTVLSGLLAAAFGLSPATAAGVFSGANVNVPALAGAIDALPAAGGDASAAEAVVGMSLTYPVGVLAAIVATVVFLRVVRPDLAGDAARNADLAPSAEPLLERTLLVTDAGAGLPLDELPRLIGADVLVSRLHRDGVTHVAPGGDLLRAGDKVNVVGTRPALASVAAAIGQPVREELSLDRRDVDRRRMTVSNPSVAGRRIADLDLPKRYGALVTRVRRGDVDVLAGPGLTLALGDRVRVVAPRQNLPAVAELFGDSDTALGRIDLRNLSIGLVAGLLLGMVPIPLPGGVTVHLGLAGGPIVAGLALGALGRTGAVTWQLPRNVAMVLRQLGVALFFAGVGTKSGHAFASYLADGGALPVIAAGALLSVTFVLLVLLAGYWVLRMPASLLLGVLAGTGTNPAALTVAEERVPNELPAVGYALVFPVAMVAKVLAAQLLVQLA